MALAQSQYLRIFDPAGLTFERWQSYYAAGAVTWESTQWRYVPFSADGFTAGVTDNDSGISISAPAIPLVINAFESALEAGRLVELRIYQFDPLAGNTAPQVGQTLIAGYVGQATGANGAVSRLALQLGAALAPVGSQMPPRTLTTLMMGKGCRL